MPINVWRELFLAAVSATPPICAAAILAVKSVCAVCRFARVTGGVGKAALPVIASMTPCAKLSSSVSESRPKQNETLVAIFAGWCQIFCVNDRVIIFLDVAVGAVGTVGKRS